MGPPQTRACDSFPAFFPPPLHPLLVAFQVAGRCICTDGPGGHNEPQAQAFSASSQPCVSRVESSIMGGVRHMPQMLTHKLFVRSRGFSGHGRGPFRLWRPCESERMFLVLFKSSSCDEWSLFDPVVRASMLFSAAPGLVRCL